MPVRGVEGWGVAAVRRHGEDGEEVGAWAGGRRVSEKGERSGGESNECFRGGANLGRKIASGSTLRTAHYGDRSLVCIFLHGRHWASWETGRTATAP
jgi:hypothetical protein